MAKPTITLTIGSGRGTTITHRPAPRVIGGNTA